MNTNTEQTVFTVPHCDAKTDANSREIIHIFNHGLVTFEDLKDELRVLKSIYRAADLTGNSDALVSKILVDHGLKAPRRAFPDDFLEHIDTIAMMEAKTIFSGLSESYNRLIQFWNAIGDEFLSVLQNNNRLIAQRLNA